MASEVISHAIFASSHPTSPRTALSYTPPSTPCFAPHPIMPCALTPIPHHPFPSHFFAPQDSFSQVPPSTSLHLSPVRQFPIRMSLHPPCSSAKPLHPAP